ncbi:MAG: SDR family oxidoreductase [Buchnera aphidicola (Periphyllus lyropictus)]|uniref:enoyl-ACP reductase FabI n=1 Tax=Buchnera aphidicola TaxID=9 RepID=UPI001ED7475C|nr:SDR family oxidoreductase [Buchnera aphidicola]NIH16614.1 SDR family oxidoreductase [Buchnera aphidicola (Periphyllus lyropictus)]USS94526.1 SDR family oxidoreductase [Buchnera aphidicola (Periphyllus lyropictus)]
MGFLSGKKILIFGLHNKYSIAYGIAKSMYYQGADLAFIYKKKKYKKRIKMIAKEFNSNIVLYCNIKYTIDIKNLFLNLKKIWSNFDGIVHSLAFLKKKFLKNNYINSFTKKSFISSHLISSYSFVKLAKQFKSILNKNSSLITVSFLGSQKFIPNYNLMGLAKASLESNVRYMAASLGPKIRINAISPGPVKTVSSYNIKGLEKILYIYKKFSPMKRNISIIEIGNVASFLSSNLSSGITGQIIYVDGGFNIVGLY